MGLALASLGKKGTVRATIPLTLSGRRRLRCQPASAPQSVPTTYAYSHTSIDCQFLNNGGGNPREREREHLLDGEVIEEGDEIADDVEPGVRGRGKGGVGVAEASQIGGDGVEAMAGEELNLTVPSEPGLREAMEKQHKRSRSFLSNVDPYSVQFDSMMIDVGYHHRRHREFLLRRELQRENNGMSLKMGWRSQSQL